MTSTTTNSRRRRRDLEARTLLLNPGWHKEGAEEKAPATETILLEQYRIYLDLTDRLASRRTGTNSFFLALHSAVLTAFGVFWRDPPRGVAAPWILVPVVAAVVLCALWFLLIAHYRTLSRGKWSVVAAFEEHLPSRPFSKAEWQGVLQSHENRRWWRRLSKLEQAVPLVFAAMYLIGTALLLVTST